MSMSASSIVPNTNMRMTYWFQTGIDDDVIYNGKIFVSICVYVQARESPKQKTVCIYQK